MPNIWMDQVDRAIRRLSAELIQKQGGDGRWSFCFEGGPMTDAYYLLLSRALGIQKDPLARKVAERILNLQTGDGTWKLYPDEREGNVSATLDACLALLYTGIKDPADPSIQKARDFLRSGGAAARAGSLSRAVLTLLGHGRWADFTRLPVEFFLLPMWSPMNFFDFVGYARVHLAPLMIAADRNFSVRLDGFHEIDDWIPPISRSLLDRIGPDHFMTREEIAIAISGTASARKELHRQALRRGEQFMLSRIEADGTLYSYFTSTFLMVFALLALGYPSHHPVIRRAFRGISSFAMPLRVGTHIQMTSSTVWDTALVLYALQEAGCPPGDEAIRKGIGYLLSRQQKRPADWSLKNPRVMPGGWGFSDINTINPDVDDTAYVLRALAGSVRGGAYRSDWRRGLDWLLSMQNRDGGWPAFEKNTDKTWLKLLPYQEGRHVFSDPSSADLTGRTMHFLGSELGWTIERPEIRRAWSWLYHHQRTDGSWYGRWGVQYIYGTWAALTGMAAVGVPRSHSAVRKGIRWLLSIQNEDGGWGESCRSDEKRKYVPLGASTPVQTAWALDALIAWHEEPTPEIQKGMECLLGLLEKRDRTWSYPAGAGLAGQFYVYYHSYPYVWPLVTLAHYWKKYGKLDEEQRITRQL
jgi:sporulenol synthase